jgi:hypothetical protein
MTATISLGSITTYALLSLTLGAIYMNERRRDARGRVA